MLRSRTLWMAAAGSLLLAGCGGGATFANKPRPPVPVNVTVYINDQRVSVSQASVGAGPVQLIVTNQASRNEAMTVVGSGSGTLANTGPINPGATAQVTVDFRTGDYLIATSRATGNDAQRAGQAPIHPATLHIGPPRPSANDALLQP